MGVNALSVDLEEYFQVSNFDGVIGRERWNDLDSRLDATTAHLLDACDEHESVATFFVLGWVAERRPELVRRILDRGHEIACHGHGHELVYELGRDRFRQDLRRARSAIEDATGVAVLGYRAPSFSITARSIWAFQILAEEGFLYDSSVFPIRHPRYGMPDFPTLPLRLDLGAGVSIREFPLTTWDIGPVRVPLAGGAYLRFLPPSLFRWAYGRMVDAGRPTVLYLHPWELDPEQPRQQTSWRVRINHYHNLRHTEARLRELLKRHRFSPLWEVLESLGQDGRLPVLELEPEQKRAA